jgi:hypothetical protein
MRAVRATGAVVTASVLLAGCGSGSERAAIVRASAAPFADFSRSDASAFCADFAASTATALVRHLPGPGGCAARMARVFRGCQPNAAAFGAEAAAGDRAEVPSALLRKVGEVSRVSWQDDRAQAVTRPPAGQAAHTIDLVKTDGRWVILGPAQLDAEIHCARYSGEFSVWLSLGRPAGHSPSG